MSLSLFFKKQIIYSFTSRLLPALLIYVSTILTIRLYGTDAYGYFSYISYLSNFTVSATSSWLTQAILMYYPENKDDKSFYTVVNIGFGISYLASLIFIFITSHDIHNTIILALSNFSLFAYSIYRVFMQVNFQNKLQLKYEFFRSCLILIIPLILLIILKNNSFYFILGGNIIGNIIFIFSSNQLKIIKKKSIGFYYPKCLSMDYL